MYKMSVLLASGGERPGQEWLLVKLKGRKLIRSDWHVWEIRDFGRNAMGMKYNFVFCFRLATCVCKTMRICDAKTVLCV